MQNTKKNIVINGYILLIAMSDEDMKKRKEEWLTKVRKEGKLNRNPTEDHSTGLKTLQNNIRRSILSLLLESPMGLDDLQNEMELTKTEAKFHIGMLENALYVEKEEKNGSIVYFPSPRAEAYMENVKSGGHK
ncbi:transcriptional regulator [Methanohalophilus euhalobius]|jgi:predicted transcriptional regulator|uniref:Transcriptional regulator n=2 Tax=Methanohalophilus TaxID=2175 RepID=A0A285FZD4_9EURY|nr:MAG: transcriptional regulator [Methanohalophilus sp. 2-GBenrich]RSD33578.1 MAG: transcriptional regulator [Methanohalophilus sp.]RXG33736.1 transcriptional regulator [Methanohalophilus sp. WG1-DM]TCL12537.1 transcriptional regulator [Methanohalophilus euhalobius]RSD34426.1 MAG: transcriptional regulator [Methanohalophilus sp.]